MSRDRVTYEWVWELTDEHDDIVEHQYLDTYREMVSSAPAGADFGLCRRVGNDDDGEIEREYAYIERGVLPERFDGGSTVPQRFHKEVVA